MNMIWLASIYRLHGYLFLGGGSPAGGHSGPGDDYRVRLLVPNHYHDADDHLQTIVSQM